MAVDRSSRTFTNIYRHYIQCYSTLYCSIHAVNFRPNWKPIAGCELLPGWVCRSGCHGNRGTDTGERVGNNNDSCPKLAQRYLVCVPTQKYQPKDTWGVCPHRSLLPILRFANELEGVHPTVRHLIWKIAPGTEVCARLQEL